ncbi:hypothetical protein [uncultured Pseudonocardia sp.]|uniref:hypothetical protein n=1 Tax=uncultured Pseudonocardia sp. TaxID=211455 RepID=UPI002635B831|nr:hypothetical protein [uncultured Pseudonocardia sp.]
MSTSTVRRLDTGTADGPTSRTAGLMSGLRSMPLFRQVVPMEALVGWPIPARHNPGWDGRTAVYLKFPLYGYHRPARRGEPTRLLPPFAMLTLNWANGAPVEFVDFRYSRPWPITATPPVIGEFPHAAVRELSGGDYLAARVRLAELYDGLFESLGDGSGFDGEAELADLLGRLLEPCLAPYYRMIAPRFAERFLGAEQE